MRSLLWLIIFVIFFVGLIRYIERHSLFFPMKEVITTPALTGLSYEAISFKTSDGLLLDSWFVPGDKVKFTPLENSTGVNQRSSSSKVGGGSTQSSEQIVKSRGSITGFTVIFCHGNAGNIGHRLEKMLVLHNLGLSVFIFDYRGYGKSQGSPSEEGLYRDLDAAYNYVIKELKVPKDRVILYGESIGGAVAIEFAQRTKPAALITEETITSVKDIVKINVPFVPYFLLSSRFDSLSKIKKVDCPKLIIHSINDEIVPFYLGKELFEEALPPKKFLEIEGSHNTAFLESKEKYTRGIKSFLDGL